MKIYFLKSFEENKRSSGAATYTKPHLRGSQRSADRRLLMDAGRLGICKRPASIDTLSSQWLKASQASIQDLPSRPASLTCLPDLCLFSFG